MCLRSCWNLPALFIAIILISAVNSFLDSDSDDNYGGGHATTSAPDPDEEWHMDFQPTGFLPDSVYRELAWYGILQIQPLYHSSKFKVAARWIWQNTHGRPCVIMEENPQAMMEDKQSHETLLEESAKWAREQRTAVEVLMENIRTGGNGLTVRTVISQKMTTSYIIQNGKTFRCEEGSQPDLDAFRQQANMHERKCTYDKEPQFIPIDLCMDAEFTPLEYSFTEGWAFCMGDGDRETVYAEDGDLDCGQKRKVLFKSFLDECAIDNNVVISFQYFGDEPRKDLIHNNTICTTWDPCRFSYLYRIEDMEPPSLPEATTDPCDTTICPECIEGFTEDVHVIQDSELVARSDKTSDVALKWVNTTFDEFLWKYKYLALKGSNNNVYVMRASHKNMTIPGKLLRGTEAYISYQGKEVPITKNFEVLAKLQPDPFSCFLLNGYIFKVNIAIPTDPNKIRWVKASTEIYDNAIPVGRGEHGYVTYICRSIVDGYLIPGCYYKEYRACFNSHFTEYQHKNYEILVRIL